MPKRNKKVLVYVWGLVNSISCYDTSIHFWKHPFRQKNNRPTTIGQKYLYSISLFLFFVFVLMLFVPCMSEQLYRAGLHKSRKIFDICFDIKVYYKRTNERTNEWRKSGLFYLLPNHLLRSCYLDEGHFWSSKGYWLFKRLKRKKIDLFWKN
jgi:hypothetical protein